MVRCALKAGLKAVARYFILILVGRRLAAFRIITPMRYDTVSHFANLEDKVRTSSLLAATGKT